MKIKIAILSFILFFIALCNESLIAQDKFTVSGYVKNESDGETILGATVYTREMPERGTATNSAGFYSLTLPKGFYKLVFSTLGYTTKVIDLDLTQNRVQSIELNDSETQLNEVVITEDVIDANVTSNRMSLEKLDIQTIKSMPALLGEVDVIRSIQMLPGVSTVGEGASGFNVRGGGVDQNLILQDESIIYNSSHLFGFFSVFNPDAVKDVTLMKGGIPAQYGGRLSSLLDVKLKEGNSKQFAGTAGIGTVSSRLALEAPIIKDKSSFIIAARRSYADLFLKLLPDFKDNQLYFYDLSAKWNYNINAKNTVYVSGYFGKDVFKFNDDFKLNWGNATGTIRWNHVFNQKLFAKFTGVYSNYEYELGVPSGTDAFSWISNIQNQNLKADLQYFINPRNTLNFGGSVINYSFSPGKITPGGDNSFFNKYELPEQRGIEYGLYIDNDRELGSRWSLQYGLRLSMFDFRGPYTTKEYEGVNGERKNLIKTKVFSNESIVKYWNPEPRFGARYSLNESSSVKMSYQRMVQYIHLISSTTAASPLDIWQPSTTNIKPETADQVAIGYFKNLKDNMFETSIEVYYKTTTNQIDYINGAETLLNEELESELLYGKGRAYGAEFYVKKKTGKINGWVSYTLAKSERQIDGLNNNDWYNAKYDRTHNISIVGIYDMNKKWSFSTSFAYLTGVAATFPNSRYTVQGIVIPDISDNSRNNYRVPAYHRLDFAATLTPKGKPNRKYTSNWVFSVYNAYNRRNAFSIYFGQNNDTKNLNYGQDSNGNYIPTSAKTQATRLAVFGSIIPSVTYNIKF